MKRHEIRGFLETKGIFLSTGTISNRSLDFLLLFKQFHINKSREIKAFIERKGCMILHMDGTNRSGGRVVFVLQEGIDNMVINADLIPSEAEEHVDPVLLDFKNSYGSPLVVVRDMAKGIKLSVKKIFPDASQQICQIHFLSDLEKDMITEYHKKLKNSIVKHKLTSKLKSLRYENNGSGDSMIKRIQDRWIHIAVDHLLFPVEKRVKWMRRPISYFIQYRRIKIVGDLVKRLVHCDASNNFVHKPLMELHESLKSVLEDSKVFEYFSIMEKVLQWLDELRDNLRITRQNNLNDSKPTDFELDEVLIKINEVLLKIRTESWKLEKQYQRIALTIIDAFESHWEELFVPDPIVKGRNISFRRHNNGLESSHRRIRKGIRERTGKSETNSEMEQFGDLLAILSNLWNETYQKEILRDVVDIGRSLSPFVKDLPRLRQEYRETRRGNTIPIDDEERFSILENFIDVFENNELDSVLISSLQSILEVEGCSEIV
ncbi:MAG: transposase [Candidatus Methanoperedens sp.]|nr:transposase [Candidatus Methanoperedens sp.]